MLYDIEFVVEGMYDSGAILALRRSCLALFSIRANLIGNHWKLQRSWQSGHRQPDVVVAIQEIRKLSVMIFAKKSDNKNSEASLRVSQYSLQAPQATVLG
jgi:hypothetical protein